MSMFLGQLLSINFMGTLCWSKSQFSNFQKWALFSKNSIFGQTFDVLPEISIFDQNFNFRQKFQFLIKSFQFLIKFWIFGKK